VDEIHNSNILERC